MVAVSLLVIAIAGPMSLAAQSLSAAFYARDQMTSFHLAQEAVEAVRFVRDGNILTNNAAGSAVVDLFAGIPDTTGRPFTVDIRYDDPSQSMKLCNGPCDPLSYDTDTSLFGYGVGSGWQATRFTRSVWVTAVNGSTGSSSAPILPPHRTMPPVTSMRTSAGTGISFRASLDIQSMQNAKIKL